jgi:hypothetical protein
MRSASIRALAAVAAAGALIAVPAAASAFCGFYVSGAGAELFNDATQVVLMREGTRTVLSMQNNYQGPPSDFAMVVPVPVVLQKENVKTLPHAIFARVDKLGAPRLVEYWEQDPCAPPEPEYDKAVANEPGAAPPVEQKGGSDLGVKIEAQFKVGEYEVVILSARDSTGLDTWLRREKYKIPEGAEPYLKPYVASGSKFFVAKVDIEKVQKVDGRLTLSPLRFHYESEEFSLPIRLGMMNSSGTQDLIVNVLGRGVRYEVANYPNVTIPTNLDVREEARGRFGEFYAALLDRTLEKNPGAVVTEYAWDAASCDPCPEPPLEPAELMTLGGDVVGGEMNYGFVLTRLHARYGKDGIREDLVFRAGKPIVGGREVRGQGGKLEESSAPSEMNNFQGRYAIRHEWSGPIACASPRRGIWGGPPAGQQIAAGPQAATGTAFVRRGAVQLASIIRQDVPQIDVKAQPDAAKPAPAPEASPGAAPIQPRKEKRGCAVGGQESAGSLGLLVLALVAIARRARRGIQS